MNDLAVFAGRYGAFIWPAYGVSLLGFAWMIGDTVWRVRRWRRQAERLEKALAEPVTIPPAPPTP